ncbi:MAG: DUF134 domain-containing protein [Candidatus Bathyarchaeia archaeon]
MAHRKRKRRGKRGRLPTPVYIEHIPDVDKFNPSPPGDKPPMVLELAELEVLRLVDLEGLTQEEAGRQMGISRGTIWRILHRAREKVVKAITEGRAIDISRP